MVNACMLHCITHHKCWDQCRGHWPLTPFVFDCKCSTHSCSRRSALYLSLPRVHVDSSPRMSQHQWGMQISFCPCVASVMLNYSIWVIQVRDTGLLGRTLAHVYTDDPLSETTYTKETGIIVIMNNSSCCFFWGGTPVIKPLQPELTETAELT